MSGMLLSSMRTPDTDEPVVEEKPGDEPEDLTGRALRLRIRQQELLAELGVLALQRTSFTDLLNQTARMTAEGLEAEFCKIMEYIPSDKRLLVRAGVGWGEDVVGNATVGADLDSPAGYALQTGKPVISNHLENEERFRTPELLVQHGIRRAMNVILQGDGLPFGVLEVDSRSEGEFGEHDIAFLQGAANVLGMAIEQQQYQRKLQAALDRHQILLKEVNHRVKNSLQVVSSMLNLQANTVGDPALSERLMEASTRILAVGRAYNRLAYNADYENIDLVGYLREIVEDLEAAVAPCNIQLDTPKEIQFAADRAILVALIVNELILNAAKHAYAGSQEGVIHLRLVSSDDKAVSISVSDDGIGLPADFDPALSKRLGTRIALGLAGQLGAELTRQKTTKGTHFTLVVPLHAKAN
ncbi:MAG: histidine kinase dimerization/phosphoacceptor domain -containing protein [Bradyrhizobium sp.]|jgi:two-component sensor histidine kinase|uniref:sensor histidine kinase n=1 Tax=Bradyrhizobium sp. TaxID=376 RepID=UPI003C725847